MLENFGFKTLGVTGSRPWIFKKEVVSEVRETIRKFLEEFKLNGGLKVLQGGALGVDTWAAFDSLDLGLSLETYVPYPEQTSRWKNQQDILNYEKILEKSSNVKTFGDHQENRLFFVRNSEIIKDSDLMLAIVGSGMDRGATWTAKKAVETGKPTVIFKWKTSGEVIKAVRNFPSE